MAKLTTTSITDGDHATEMNTNLTAIETAVENTLSRDGTAPNQMNADFDLNSNFILNMPAGTAATHPLQKQQIESLLASLSELAVVGAGTQYDLLYYDGSSWVPTSGISWDGNHLSLPSFNDAVTPTLAFGDGDTGIYEYADDGLGFTFAGTQRWRIFDSAIEASLSNGPTLRSETPSATNPNIIPGRTDVDTGIGTAAADQLSLIAGGKEMLRLNETGLDSSDQLIIMPNFVSGTNTTPALAFGDGDTGFYEQVDDQLVLALTGQNKWFFVGNTFYALSASGPYLLNAASSGTSPNLVPARDDTNTGIGQAGDDQLSLVAGGVEMMRLQETGLDTTDQLIIKPASVGSIGAAATPAIAFGDGDTGFYEGTDDQLHVALNGLEKWHITANLLQGAATGAPCMENSDSTDTNPGHTFKNDLDTGIGSAGLDQLSLIAGGVEMARAVEGATDYWDFNDLGVRRMVIEDYAIQDPGEYTPTGTTQTLTYSDGPAFQVDLESVTGNITITLSGGPPTGTYGQIIVKVTQDSTVARTITWAGGTFRWVDGTAHVMNSTLNGFSIYTFETWDAGTTWWGAGADYS